VSESYLHCCAAVNLFNFTYEFITFLFLCIKQFGYSAVDTKENSWKGAANILKGKIGQDVPAYFSTMR
jgi:hypothetical protein